MSKRSAFQFRRPPSKMPKLDITVLNGEAIVSSQAYGPSQMSAAPRLPAQQQPLPLPAQQAQPESAMWGDDDDDEFVMLASQVAARVEAASEAVISQAMNFTADMSYGRFQNEVDASTQLTAPIKNKPMFDELMEDDFEDIFAKVPDFSNIPEQAKVAALQQPLATTATTSAATTSTATSQLNRAVAVAMPKDNTAQKNAQKEAQAAFLQNKIRELKKEYEALRESSGKISEKCQQKEGEVSSLRYELGLKEQQIDRLRKEKMSEISTLEKKYTEKVVNLEKTVEAQKSEIEFKNLDQTIKNKRLSRQSSSYPAAQNKENAAPAQTLKEWQKHSFYHLSLSTERCNDHTKLNINSIFPHITYNDANTMQSMNGKNPELIARFQYLQTMILQTGFEQLKRLNAGFTEDIVKLIEELTKSMSACVERLEIQQHKEFNPSLEYKLQSESFRAARAGNVSTWNANGLQRKPQEKKMVYESRVLTSIAAICGHFTTVPILLMDRDFSGSIDSGAERMEVDGSVASFVGILTDVLIAIANSGNMEAYQDFVAASILLLNVLNEKLGPSRVRNHTLFKLFRAIVFCRPEIHLLEPLSEYVETIPGQESLNGPNRLCSDLKCSNFVSYTNQNIRRYSSDVCPLQIYAVLLETGVHHHDTESSDCPESRVAAIAQIAIRSMNFLRYCFKHPTRWLMAHGADGSANGSNCHCYSLMVTSTIAQLYVVIKCWINNMNCLDAKMMQTIFKMASILLHDNFAFENYKPKILFLGSLPIQNRLQVIYDRIMSCRHLFKLEMAHEAAIQNVNLRRIPQLIEVQSAPLKRPTASDETQNEGLDILNDSFASFLATARQI